MSLLLYAITEPDARSDPPGGGGIDGLALHTVCHAGLSAVVSDRPEALEPTETRLLAYQHAIGNLMAGAPVLPAHFPTAVSSESDLRQLLEDRADEFGGMLGRVRGAVELELRADLIVTPADGAVDEARAGTTYMLQRLALDRRAQEIATELDRTFGGWTRAGTVRTASAREAAVVAAYLVDTEQVEEFLVRVRGLEESTDDATFVCTGPWPPYSFVGTGA